MEIDVKGDGESLEALLNSLVNSLQEKNTPSVSQAQSFLMQIALRLTDYFRQIYGVLRGFKDSVGFDYAELFTLRRCAIIHTTPLWYNALDKPEVVGYAGG